MPTGEAIVLGTFQRASEVESALPLVRRGSGGHAVKVGPGSVWVSLALPRVDSLVACTPDKIVNRYVRPLLRALTRVTNIPASYFGRDWISMGHRPVGLVAFGHEASTNRALFEAIIAVTSPFALTDRPSFLGKVPATLRELTKRSLVDDVVTAILDGYGALATVERMEPVPTAPVEVSPRDRPWTSQRDEAIGRVAAGRDATGTLRVGGELMASIDAVAKLEANLAAVPSDVSSDDVGRIVDDAFTTGNAVVFGIKSLTTIRDAVVEALAAP